MAASLERVLSYLDHPEVTELVIGVNRPLAVKMGKAYRALSTQVFSRDDIVELVAGSSLSGLIDSRESLPGIEVHACSRWIVVEVVRYGDEIALRVSLPDRDVGASSPPPASAIIDPPTTRFKTAPPTRTPAQGVPVQTTQPIARTPTQGVPVQTTQPITRTPTQGVPVETQSTRTRPGVSVQPTQPIARTPPGVSVQTTQPMARTPAQATQTTHPITRTPPHGVPVQTTQPMTRTPPQGVPITNTMHHAPASGVPIAPAPATGSSSIPRTTTPPSTAATRGPATPSGVSARGTSTPPTGGTTARGTTPAPANNASYSIGPPTVPPNAHYDESPTVRSPLRSPDPSPPSSGPLPTELVISEPGEIEVLLTPPDAWTGPRIIDERANVSALVPLLRAARTARATDLHVSAGRLIMIRRVGELVPLDAANLPSGISPGLRAALSGPLSTSTAHGLLWPLLGPSGQKQVINLGYADLACEVPGAGRVRINVSRQQEGLSGTFRLITPTTPTLESLGLPKELAKVIGHHQGLVVIAGPNGHGKTTTMAALVDQLNSTKKHHIITIEEPVEVEHERKLAIVSHREVLRHTLNFVAALKASLREDPDVIVIGELRDAETVEIALTAAETGHLVLATMSTPSAAKTIDRLIDMFPPDDQPQVRASISGTLRAVIAQRLLPSADNSAMVAAVELVTGVLPLASMIRDNKLYQLPNLMQRGRAFGMIRLDDSLLELVRAKKITPAVALAASENKKELSVALGKLGPL